MEKGTTTIQWQTGWEVQSVNIRDYQDGVCAVDKVDQRRALALKKDYNFRVIRRQVEVMEDNAHFKDLFGLEIQYISIQDPKVHGQNWHPLALL
eukprot:5934693-Ditylum_brightwellii.AAC.1